MSVGRDSSRELRASVPPKIDIYQSKVSQNGPRSPRLQRPVNNTRVSFTENPSRPGGPSNVNIAGHQPALLNNRPINQTAFAPINQAAATSRTLRDPLPFPSNEPVEQLPFPSDVPGGQHSDTASPAAMQAPSISNNPANPAASPTAQAGSGKKKKGLSKQLMLIIRIGITLALIVLILKGVSWSAVANTYAHVHFTDLLVGLCMGLLGVVFSSYLWHRLVRAENIQADMSHLTRLYLIGVAFSNFLPTSMGGDALKAYYVGRDSGNMPGSASAVVLARITGFFGMMLMATPVLIVLHASFNGLLVQRFVLLSLLYLSSFGGALIIAAFLPKIQQKYVRGAWSGNKFVLKAFETGTTLLLSFKRPRPLIEAIMFGFLFWITNCLNYYEYAVALGVQTPFRFYLLAVPFIGVIGALPISISGYGVREGLVEYLYSTIHVPTSTALSVVLLMDMQRILFSLLGGLLFLTMENRARNVEAAAPAAG
jgi:uncharacterized protein (TIRG00374 family)